MIDENELMEFAETICDSDCDNSHDEKNCASDMPIDDILYNTAELFKVFGDLTRVRIIHTLFKNEMCVCNIASALNMTHSAISHQLRVLKQARIVKYRREGKTVFYSLEDYHVYNIFKQAFEHIKE